MNNPKITYYESGAIFSKEYFLEGKLHRENGPAIIAYFETGEIKVKNYFLNGQRHRIDGPAYIRYFKSGKIKEEAYWINHQWHRFDGPAITSYHKSGEIKATCYYVHGRYLPEFNKYFSKNMSIEKIFEYVQMHPEYVQYVEILAKENNWLTEKQILLMNVMNFLK